MIYSRRLTTGFTLIEILVVLFIISIVSSVALLSISRNENQHIQSFANELTQMITLAEEQAMLQPMVLGLAFSDSSFHFAELRPSVAEKKNVWIPIQDKLLGKHPIPSDIAVDVKSGNVAAESVSEEEKNNNPQIIISTNGDLTPFKIYIGKQGQKPRYAITGDADGNVTNKELD